MRLWWVTLDAAVAAVAIVLIDATGTRPLDRDCVADPLVRLMFPAPPRPPACYKTPGIKTRGMWIDKANVTHHNDVLLLRFGFGWLGRKRQLEIRHIAGRLMCAGVEIENATGDEAEAGGNESTRTTREREETVRGTRCAQAF